MPIQRMYTVASAISSRFAIVWTRSTALARSWASDKWGIDSTWVDVWPTRGTDQRQMEEKGPNDFYA